MQVGCKIVYYIMHQKLKLDNWLFLIINYIS